MLYKSSKHGVTQNWLINMERRGYYQQKTTAARYAKRSGSAMFDVQFEQGKGWYWQPSTGPQAEWAHAVADLHEEISWAGERDGTPVVTVHVFKHELPDLPKEFLVEPVTPSLWVGDTKQRTSSTAPKERSTHASPVAHIHEWLTLYHEEHSAVPTVRDAVAELQPQGINVSTIRTQYYKWRKNSL